MPSTQSYCSARYVRTANERLSMDRSNEEKYQHIGYAIANQQIFCNFSWT